MSQLAILAGRRPASSLPAWPVWTSAISMRNNVINRGAGRLSLSRAANR